VHCSALNCAVDCAYELTVLFGDLCLITFGCDCLETTEERANTRDQTSIFKTLAL
jgi:hypothetical protein